MAYEHEHGYFLFKTFVEYELIESDLIETLGYPVYEKVEFAILSCKCGDVTKRRIEQKK